MPELLSSAATARPTAGRIDAIETAVSGLGYDLVGVERGPAGLVRVTIDRHPAPAGTAATAASAITVDDCERVTRQLQHVLTVEGVAYERLEVSSPGLDRVLRHAADFERFQGEEIDLTLKVPFQGRKRYRGRLVRHGDDWRVVLPAQASPRAEAPIRALDFSLDEVREARLVPHLNFKGRSNASTGAAGPVLREPTHKTAGGQRA